MISQLLYATITALLVRADGWGPESESQFLAWPKWKRELSNFFSAYTCSLLFGIMMTHQFDLLVGITSAFAFWLYRFPGFNGWQVWRYMFIRGLWPLSIGLALVGLAAHANPYYALLAIPAAPIYATIYYGGYKWLPQTIAGLDRHVWIELASGYLLYALILITSK